MDGEFSPVAIVAFFSAISKGITELAYKPIRGLIERFWPESPGAYIADQLTPYVAWLISGVLVWYSKVNLFEGFMPTGPGILFTALASGLGANLISDAFDWPKTLAREIAIYKYALGDAKEEEIADSCCGKP